MVWAVSEANASTANRRVRLPTVVDSAAVPSSFRRFAPDLRGSSLKTAFPDLLAGLTVAALAVPQGLAYALVAGVPLQMGLFAAALPAIVAALWGSSRFLVTGPTNPIALVVGASIVAPALALGEAVPVETVLATGLLAGVLLAVFGLVGLGRASRFLSDSVVVGFATGAGILIALRLLPELSLELPPVAPSQPLAPKVWPLLVRSVQTIATADWRALGLAALVPIVVVGLRRVDARIPGGLLGLAAATGIASALGWSEGSDAISLIGSVPAGFPEWHAPALFGPALDPARVGAPALAIALLATLQSIAAARTLRGPGEARLDPDRELFAQGAANITAACVGALPTSGSLTRSALARSAGARSRLAPAVSGLAVAGLLPVLGPLIQDVPLAALVGLVVLSGLELVNPASLRRAATTRSDAMILVVTLVATLWIDLVQALYAGLFFSLALLVVRSGRLQMVELVRSAGDRFREIPLDARTGQSPAVLLHLEGDLNFAVAPELADRLNEIGARAPRLLVLRLKRARHLDATVLEVLRECFVDLQRSGTSVVLCGLTDELAELLEGTELAQTLGPEGLLRSGERLFEGFEKALARARQLLRPLSDDQIFRTEQSAHWMYEI